uniref:Uncharacterized protein n=1 Tax=Ciona savignyi TaxID=51511 RepID=H2ZBH8_CIOSA
MSECLKRRGSTQQSKASQYLKQIGHFHKQIMYEAEKLRNFTKHESGLNAFSSDRVTGSSEALSHLSKKVFDLVAYCESEFVQDAVRSLEAASPSYKPLYNDYVHGPPNGADGQEESSVLVDMDDNVTFNSSTASSVSEYKADNLWDELTITVQLKLANVAKSINMVTTPDTEAAFLRGEATTDDHREAALTDLTALLTLVDKLCTEVNSSLYFIDLR